MPRIAIFGPGLLGGSIALKLRESGTAVPAVSGTGGTPVSLSPGAHIGLWARRGEAVADLRARGIADTVSSDIGEIACDADFIILCVPVAAMRSLALEIARFIKPGCVVTDVGSVKASVVAELAPIFEHFIGSHPMAGKAEAGIDAAEAGLFANTNCILTPHNDDTASAEIVRAFWQKLGCRVVTMPAREHDECVALISHLPHIVAGNLVRAVAEKNAAALGIVGPGFRDTTRVASGPPELWTGIIAANQPAIIDAIDAMIAKLGEFRQTVARVAAEGGQEELTNLLADAKRIRDHIQFP